MLACSYIRKHRLHFKAGRMLELLPIAPARQGTDAQAGTVEQVDCAARLEYLSLRIVRESRETTMRRLDDLFAEIRVHRDFDDRSPRLRASEEFPSLEELLHADAPDAERFGQVTVAKASLAGHAPRDNDGMRRPRERIGPNAIR